MCSVQLVKPFYGGTHLLHVVQVASFERDEQEGSAVPASHVLSLIGSSATSRRKLQSHFWALIVCH